MPIIMAIIMRNSIKAKTEMTAIRIGKIEFGDVVVVCKRLDCVEVK